MTCVSEKGELNFSIKKIEEPPDMVNVILNKHEEIARTGRRSRFSCLKLFINSIKIATTIIIIFLLTLLVFQRKEYIWEFFKSNETIPEPILLRRDRIESCKENQTYINCCIELFPNWKNCNIDIALDFITTYELEQIPKYKRQAPISQPEDFFENSPPTSENLLGYVNRPPSHEPSSYNNPYPIDNQHPYEENQYNQPHQLAEFLPNRQHDIPEPDHQLIESYSNLQPEIPQQVPQLPESHPSQQHEIHEPDHQLIESYSNLQPEISQQAHQLAESHPNLQDGINEQAHQSIESYSNPQHEIPQQAPQLAESYSNVQHGIPEQIQPLADHNPNVQHEIYEQHQQEIPESYEINDYFLGASQIQSTDNEDLPKSTQTANSFLPRNFEQSTENNHTNPPQDIEDLNDTNKSPKIFSHSDSQNTTDLKKSSEKAQTSTKIEPTLQNSTLTKNSSQILVNGERISQGKDINPKSDDLTERNDQNNQNSPPCIMYPMMQDARAMYPFPYAHPPLYMISPDMYSPSPHFATAQMNPYAMQPPPQFSPYPPMYYNHYRQMDTSSTQTTQSSQSSKNTIKVSGPGGQFYICNPINTPANGLVNMPGVEIRRNLGTMNLQELVETSPSELGNHTREAIECPFGEWSCFDGSKCIAKRHQCDNEIHCNDGSDEMFCSCRARVTEMRLCDGFEDCPNGEDEENCFGCSESEFSCDDWSKFRAGTCIPISQRCDGIKQCQVTGKDEEDCSILIDQLTHKNQQEIDTSRVSNAVGFLYRNFKGRWYPTCLGSEQWAIDVCQTEAGPSLGMPKVQMLLTNHQSSGPFAQLLPTGGIELTPSCSNGNIAFVECAPLFCGLRITMKNPYRPAEIDTSGEELLNHLGTFRAEDDEADDVILGASRVVGGKPSQPAAWPWLVSIYKNGLFHCGAVLINEEWIVTAAHCVDRYWFFYYQIEIGMLRRYSYSPMEQIKWAQLAIPHEQYDKKTLKNDIALIKLSSPVRFNRYVRPICLPSEATAGRDYLLGPAPGTVCVTVGWGATVEHGNDPDHMREVEVPILPQCKRNNDIQGDEICAGLLEGGKDACQGDSGGPLMCRNVNNPTQWYLAGIVSHGEGCARPNEPGVYTKVSKYLSWIADSIRLDNNGQKRPLQHCPGYVCKATGKCLPKKRHCDKMVDCLLGDDEFGCWKSKTPFPNVIVGSAQNATSKTRSVVDDLLNFFNFEPMKSSSIENRTNTNVPEEITTINLPIVPIKMNDTKESKRNLFRCRRLLQIIPLDQKCNHVLDCEDGTDEEDCSCIDYLQTSYPETICDGLTDCKDMSDEMDCTKCTSSQYFCRLSQQCIPLSNQCDGKSDCQKGEDEWDCMALTDGKTLTLDSDLRPRQTMKGIITINRFGVWRPLCTNASDNAPSIATNVCNLLGFEEYTTYHQLFLQDKPLNVTIDSFKSNFNQNINQNNVTDCNGLLIGCSKISLVRQVYRDNNASTDELYTLPWTAVIYADGKYRCVGTILNSNWIVTSKTCMERLIPGLNYVATLLGKGTKTQLNVEGPHEQILQIATWIEVGKSDVILLNTLQKINFNRYIQPIHLTTRTTFLEEKCVALGLEKGAMRFLLLESLNNCTTGFRCFRNTKTTDESFKNFETSGTITCLSHDGWYAAAVFNTLHNLSMLNLTSLNFIKKDIDVIMNSVHKSVNYTTCPGFLCKLGHCIKTDQICNGIYDCRGGEDEDFQFCQTQAEYCHLAGSCSCKPWEIRCKNGNCIPKESFCDGINDCTDYSDEPASCTCKTYMELAHPEKVCDGIVNCNDRSDEDPHLCGCRSQGFRCGRDNICVSNEMICDGFNDCPNGEDEAMCYLLRTDSISYNKGEVMMQTAGNWHSGCFARNLTTSMLEEICKKLGFAGGSAKQLPTPEGVDDSSMKLTRDPFQSVWIRRTKLKKLKWWIRTGNQPLVTQTNDPNCHKLFIECL